MNFPHREDAAEVLSASTRELVGHSAVNHVHVKTGCSTGGSDVYAAEDLSIGDAHAGHDLSPWDAASLSYAGSPRARSQSQSRARSGRDSPVLLIPEDEDLSMEDAHAREEDAPALRDGVSLSYAGSFGNRPCSRSSFASRSDYGAQPRSQMPACARPTLSRTRSSSQTRRSSRTRSGARSRPASSHSRSGFQGARSPPRGRSHDTVPNESGQASSRSPSPASSHASNLSDGIDIAADPLYEEIEEIFDKILEDEDLTDAHIPYNNTARPRALNEHPLIRNAYVHVYVASVVHGATKDLCKHLLDGYFSMFAALPATAGYEVGGLEDMARTLRTVERRLGVDPDRYITFYFCCNICWDHHHPLKLYQLAGAFCPRDGCPGVLFTEKVMADGDIKRIPVKVIPTTDLITSLYRIASRPDRVADWNAWRGDSDEARQTPPLEQDDWPGWTDPSYRMFDIMDGWRWRTIAAGLQRRRGGCWGINDIDVDGLNQQFVALPNGLVLQINLDWRFRATKKGGYSVGAVYITICNNPRAIRFRREETILYCVIPGPQEPTTDHLNSILLPLIKELQRLYGGISFQISDDDEPELLHAFLNNITSDLPAAHKLNGLRGHTSNAFMCDMCDAPFNSLVNPECFDPGRFRFRDDWRFIKYAFLSRVADEDERAEILEKRGVQWLVLDSLADWLPGRDSPPDFMHAAYLGEAKHVVQGILAKGGMFTQRRRSDKPLEKINSFLASIWWPAWVSRPPTGLISGGSGKADQWRNLISVLPVALYVAWQIDGEIPDKDAPLPRSSTKASKARQRVEELLNKRRRAHVAADPETTGKDMEELAHLRMSRNYRDHYETTMEWATSLRIYGSQSISVEETMRAADCHARACQAWARMFCHLMPYFHIMMHLWFWILFLGPVYAWWCYAFERNNGFLARLRHNGHTGGQLEATMMRGWTKSMLLFELIEHLDSLVNKSAQDVEAITKLRSILKGNTADDATQRGTLLTMIATMNAERGNGQ
ncbi:hypothetical protein BN946_scf185007.g86 [Trametes cinnabarina]|uniref:Uncharacterized protein n=1 Tax=Pycnoporus cinnabarinus TaxID=5643 RepID=A0A060SET7_PYCCI|nr:hypothetical protein BN946_scf185007.g86 [Trametes cinnabarina]